MTSTGTKITQLHAENHSITQHNKAQAMGGKLLVLDLAALTLLMTSQWSLTSRLQQAFR
jgi:hypothetical protein